MLDYRQTEIQIGSHGNEKMSITFTLDEWNSIIRNLQNVNPDLANVLIAADLEVILNVPDKLEKKSLSCPSDMKKIQKRTRVTWYVWVSHEDKQDYFNMCDKVHKALGDDYRNQVQDVETDASGDISYDMDGNISDDHPGDIFIN